MPAVPGGGAVKRPSYVPRGYHYAGRIYGPRPPKPRRDIHLGHILVNVIVTLLLIIIFALVMIAGRGHVEPGVQPCSIRGVTCG